MAILTISQVAKQAGVKIDTVRFYEKQGLIPEPPRRASGYRMYSEDAVRRLQFIRHAKELGFTLEEIGELLSLRVSSGTTCREVRSRAKQKIADIDARVKRLALVREALVRLSASCRNSNSDCPILESLESDLGSF